MFTQTTRIVNKNALEFSSETYVGYSCPSSGYGSRSSSMSPHQSPVSKAGCSRSPTRPTKVLSEETFIIADTINMDHPMESKAKSPLMMMAIPISSREQYLELLDGELIARQRVNESKRVKLAADLSQFKVTLRALNQMISDHQTRCQSKVQLMVRGGHSNRKKVEKIIMNSTSTSPQKSTAMDRIQRKLAAKRIALYQHDHSSFYLWQRELQRFMAEIEGKMRSQTLTAWDQGELKVVALRNLVETEKVEEYLLMERAQILAECSHRILCAKRMEFKKWRALKRELDGLNSTQRFSR